jgi:hypothetical protein
MVDFSCEHDRPGGLAAGFALMIGEPNDPVIDEKVQQAPQQVGV